MKLVWLTDVHLNFLPEDGAKRFGKRVRDEHPDLDAAVVTGDIAESHSFGELIEDFARGLDAPVHFVLGNHDAYYGSIAGAKSDASAMAGKARWLPQSALVDLAPDAVLVGHDGWYDARLGDALRSRVVMSDFILIREIMEARGRNMVNPDKAMVAYLNRLGSLAAEEARTLLTGALNKGYTRVLFATHVPPFAQATWHEGNHSNQNWLPWMSCKAMGVMLREVAKAHPGVQFRVLCGHTHSPGAYRAEKNLEVLTGSSDYGRPHVSGVFEY